MDLDLNRVAWARRLKLRHLEMFLALENAGGITAAAERMHMTQPAVSHWLSDMEDVIGSPLFVRGRKLRLTPAGEILRRHAERMLGDVQRADRELAAVRTGMVGRLQVGCVHSAALELLPRAIATMQAQHPGIAVHVEENTMPPLLEQLSKRRLDLVIGIVDLRAHRYAFATRPLLEDVVRIVCSPDHPLARKRKPTWEEASAYPWVLPPPVSLTRLRFEEACAQQGMELPVPRVETVSVAAILAQVRATDCLAALSGLVANFYKSLKLLSFVPLVPVIELGELGLIWADDDPNPLLAELVAALRGCIARPAPMSRQRVARHASRQA
jgi:DNA-binding transcriptional LysR family regulator